MASTPTRARACGTRPTSSALYGFGTAGSTAAPLSIRTTEYDIDRGGLTGRPTGSTGRPPTISGGFWHEVNNFNQARRFYAETAAAPSRDPLDFQENPFATQWQYASRPRPPGHIEDEWTVTDALKVNFGFKAMEGRPTPSRRVVGNPLAGDDRVAEDNVPAAGRLRLQSHAGSSKLFGGYTENMGAYVSAATSGPFASQNQAAVDYITKTLEPETSKTFEGGMRYRNDRFQGVAALYHVTFENRLLAASTAAPILGLPAVLSNVGGVETNGLELAGEYKLTDNWSVYGAYTYNQSEYQDNVVDGSGVVTARTAGKEVVNTPKNILKGELKFELAGFYSKLGVAYTGERYYTYENIGGQVDSTTVADLTLGYRFSDDSVWGKGLEIQANITNLTDEDYISTIGSGGFLNNDAAGTGQTVLTAPPRQFFVSIKKAF